MQRTWRRARVVLWMLLASGATVQARAATDATLDLLTAARHGDVVALRKALADGASVNATDPEFAQTALIRAAMFGQPAVVEALLAAKADPNKASYLSRTPLHWAAASGAADIISMLAKSGARVDAVDGYDETPLDYAAEAGQVAAAKALLAAGARVEKLKKPLSRRLPLVLGNGITGPPLDVLLAIAATGRGLEVKDETFHRTALLAAAEYAHRDGQVDVVTALLRAGADRTARNERGRTAVEEVESTLSTQKDPAMAANLRAVAAALR